MDESFRLFTLGPTIHGTPQPLASARFTDLGALELHDIERWVLSCPDVLGEELLVITSQFDQWDRSRDRLDVLLLDRGGLLVIAELKRDDSGSSQDVQAVKYAAFASTLSSERVIDAFVAHRRRLGESIEPDEATERLREWVDDGTLDRLDDEAVQPRIILAAGTFRPTVTATVLWLRRFGMDITCVQLRPFEIGDEVVLASTVLIPLRQAGDYEVRVQEKRATGKRSRAGRPLDHERAKAFVRSIPAGRWASYGDVATAAGSPQGAQAIGNWLLRHGEDLEGVHRVLRGTGEVSPGWAAQ